MFRASVVLRAMTNSSGERPANRLTSRLAVYDQSLERLDPSARPDVMAALSQATGGRCLSVDQREQVFEYARRSRQVRRGDRRPTYVFNHPAVFAVIAGLFGFELFLRRWHGLL